MLTPILALITWTMIVWIWMFATRIPAMQKAKIDPESSVHPGALSALPSEVRAVSDNYNHLHEQPVIFYALAFYSHLAGNDGAIAVGLAWGYVAARIIHSLVQIVLRKVTLRFVVFLIGSLLLKALAILNLVVLFK